MDDEDTKFDGVPEFIPTGDPVIDRGHVMIQLAREIDMNTNPAAADLLYAYMEKVYQTVKMPPMGQLKSISEHDEVEGNA